jgi:predicted ester cyclase
MGTARRAAAEVTAALEDQDFEHVRSWLADGFTFDDPASPTPPMDADQWLEANRKIFDAFPDFTYNFEILEEDGDQVWVRARMEGTHDGDWDLSAMGIGIIPATGQRIVTSPSVTVGTVNADGHVERIEVVEGNEDSGIPGILRQLGIEMG